MTPQKASLPPSPIKVQNVTRDMRNAEQKNSRFTNDSQVGKSIQTIEHCREIVKRLNEII